MGWGRKNGAGRGHRPSDEGSSAPLRVAGEQTEIKANAGPALRGLGGAFWDPGHQVGTNWRTEPAGSLQVQWVALGHSQSCLGAGGLCACWVLGADLRHEPCEVLLVGAVCSWGPHPVSLQDDSEVWGQVELCSRGASPPVSRPLGSASAGLPGLCGDLEDVVSSHIRRGRDHPACPCCVRRKGWGNPSASLSTTWLPRRGPIPAASPGSWPEMQSQPPRRCPQSEAVV